MTFIRRILEVISKLNSPRYFDRHGCNQLRQRIQKARDYPFNRNAILLFHSELLDKQLPVSTSTLAGTSSTVSALPPVRIYTFQKCYVTHNLGKFFQEPGRLLQMKIQQRVWFDGSRILVMIGNLSPWGNTRWQVLSSNSTPSKFLDQLLSISHPYLHYKVQTYMQLVVVLQSRVRVVAQFLTPMYTNTFQTIVKRPSRARVLTSEECWSRNKLKKEGERNSEQKQKGLKKEGRRKRQKSWRRSQKAW